MSREDISGNRSDEEELNYIEIEDAPPVTEENASEGEAGGHGAAIPVEIESSVLSNSDHRSGTDQDELDGPVGGNFGSDPVDLDGELDEELVNRVLGGGSGFSPIRRGVSGGSPHSSLGTPVPERRTPGLSSPFDRMGIASPFGRDSSGNPDLSTPIPMAGAMETDEAGPAAGYAAGHEISAQMQVLKSGIDSGNLDSVSSPPYGLDLSELIWHGDTKVSLLEYSYVTKGKKFVKELLGILGKKLGSNVNRCSESQIFKDFLKYSITLYDCSRGGETPIHTLLDDIVDYSESVSGDDSGDDSDNEDGNPDLDALFKGVFEAITKYADDYRINCRKLFSVFSTHFKFVDLFFSNGVANKEALDFMVNVEQTRHMLGDMKVDRLAWFKGELVKYFSEKDDVLVDDDVLLNLASRFMGVFKDICSNEAVLKKVCDSRITHDDSLVDLMRWAISKRNSELVGFLIRKEWDRCKTYEGGRNALHLVVVSDDIFRVEEDIIMALMNEDIIRQEDNEGLNPAELAILNGRLDMYVAMNKFHDRSGSNKEITSAARLFSLSTGRFAVDESGRFDAERILMFLKAYPGYLREVDPVTEMDVNKYIGFLFSSVRPENDRHYGEFDFLQNICETLNGFLALDIDFNKEDIEGNTLVSRLAFDYFGRFSGLDDKFRRALVGSMGIAFLRSDNDVRSRLLGFALSGDFCTDRDISNIAIGGINKISKTAGFVIPPAKILELCNFFLERASNAITAFNDVFSGDISRFRSRNLAVEDRRVREHYRSSQRDFGDRFDESCKVVAKILIAAIGLTGGSRKSFWILEAEVEGHEAAKRKVKELILNVSKVGSGEKIDGLGEGGVVSDSELQALLLGLHEESEIGFATKLVTNLFEGGKFIGAHFETYFKKAMGVLSRSYDCAGGGSLFGGGGSVVHLNKNGVVGKALEIYDKYQELRVERGNRPAQEVFAEMDNTNLLDKLRELRPPQMEVEEAPAVGGAAPATTTQVSQQTIEDLKALARSGGYRGGGPA